MSYFYRNDFELKTTKDCVMLLVICELSWWYNDFLMKEIRLYTCLLDLMAAMKVTNGPFILPAQSSHGVAISHSKDFLEVTWFLEKPR